MDFHGVRHLLSHFSKTYYMFPFSFGHLQIFLNVILNNVNQKSHFPKGNCQKLIFKAIQQTLKSGYKNLLATPFDKNNTLGNRISFISKFCNCKVVLPGICTGLEYYLYIIYYYTVFTIYQGFPSTCFQVLTHS